MSYTVYSTKGFILGSFPSGEASKIYLIYTEDFGLIRARAQGVRLLGSKLRYNLDDYISGAFNLVKGKEVWRLTGIEKTGSAKSSAVLARVLNLVRRLVHGEEKNPKLFASISEAEREELHEPFLVGRVLHSLGYMEAEALRGKNDEEMVRAINRALKETHLV